MNVRKIAAISGAEARLLVRNTAVAVAALVMPLVIAGMFVVSGLQQSPPDGWGYFVALMLVTVFGMSGCISAAGTLTYRRDELYLKRLRCSQSSDATILAGVLAPAVVVTIAQCAIVLAIIGIAASSLPAHPPLLVAVIVLGTVMSVGLGMATTGFSSSGEQAQTVATPVFFVLIGTAIWAGMSLGDGPDGLSPVQALSPGGAVVQLAQLSYDSGSTLAGAAAEALPSLAALAGWAVVGAGAARRYFRWEPRA
ncbi:ABC transporter [Saccharomonospora piscinae]|uniref:ABC transporter n=1 Tax=Saccharomonospora piscinae TaxID=687388 RepID=A0A1V8ZWY9_SACPI|nr:ABC transporter permease [Saccharomonospora piscinae]OQO89415.1 ABC transporter [Saccharomonospora piscinae]TLW91106.1 ABC transporter permease [Saccharomonospora piscinae]